MNTDEGREQKTHVVVDTPNEHREVMTRRTETAPDRSGPSTGTIALFAIAAIAVIGIVVYMISNRNAERAADRNANLTAATINSNQQIQPPTTIIQQPAAQPQQAPVIIQQAPAQQQQPPVIIQQAAPQPARDGAGADANVQEAAIQKLSENDGMALVTIKVSRGTATLSGSATSATLKSQAERIVRAVRGVTAVDNQITVSSL
ncbi:MAG TPA: BON domain-containing protein [Pyrinomonadaceae bacterium]|nr:BON domain-containing protein [Pyrinomonadaceae bacterium]